jgi:hypothetical protein
MLVRSAKLVVPGFRRRAAMTLVAPALKNAAVALIPAAIGTVRAVETVILAAMRIVRVVEQAVILAAIVLTRVVTTPTLAATLGIHAAMKFVLNANIAREAFAYLIPTVTPAQAVSALADRASPNPVH